MTNHPGGVLRWSRTNGNVVVSVVGKVTVILSDTVATFALPNTGTNVWARLTATVLADWTAHVNQRITYTNGPAVGASTFVALVNPQAAGLTVAEVNYAQQPPTAANNYSGGQVNPLAGNAFNLESLSQVDQLILECLDATDQVRVAGVETAKPAFVVADLYAVHLATRANCRAGENHVFCTVFSATLGPILF